MELTSTNPVKQKLMGQELQLMHFYLKFALLTLSVRFKVSGNVIF